MANNPTVFDLQVAQLVQSTIVACGTLLVYDFLCTFDQEVTYVWKQKWSLGTLLFLLNRYLPFVDTFLSLSLKLTMNTPEKCHAHFTVVTWFIVSGIVISEIILVLRTYAIWEGKRCIAIVLCISSVVTFIPAIIITELELRSLKYLPSDKPGCRLSYASPIILVAYILLVMSETTMAILTGVKAYRHLRHSSSPWVVQLYREGLLFYVYLLVVSLANVLVPVLAPRIFSNWLASPQRVLHSVLCNRVLLLILKQRSAANMTTRYPVARDSSGARPVVFTSFVDEQTSADLTIVRPSVGEGASMFSSDDIANDTYQYGPRGLVHRSGC